ncbi:MAG: segregation and condensation protein A [bacterium]
MDATEQIDLYNIKVPVFEGPLDLLLHLIREHKIDIYDIPIALITGQYLQYLEMMKELNLEIAGEFLVMAATLIHIKSRMLLPADETVSVEEQEDPRLELVQRLLEYQALKEAALSLREKEETWRDYFRREPAPDEKAEAEAEKDLSLFDLSLFDLIGAFRKFLEKAPLEAAEITRETLTVKDKIAFIVDRLSSEEAVPFEELFAGDRTKAQMVVTFIALLEIIRLGLARAYQDKEFGVIWIINPQAKREEQGNEGAPDTGAA